MILKKFILLIFINLIFLTFLVCSTIFKIFSIFKKNNKQTFWKVSKRKTYND